MLGLLLLFEPVHLVTGYAQDSDRGAVVNCIHADCSVKNHLDVSGGECVLNVRESKIFRLIDNVANDVRIGRVGSIWEGKYLFLFANVGWNDAPQNLRWGFRRENILNDGRNAIIESADCDAQGLKVAGVGGNAFFENVKPSINEGLFDGEAEKFGGLEEIISSRENGVGNFPNIVSRAWSLIKSSDSIGNISSDPDFINGFVAHNCFVLSQNLSAVSSNHDAIFVANKNNRGSRQTILADSPQGSCQCQPEKKFRIKYYTFYNYPWHHMGGGMVNRALKAGWVDVPFRVDIDVSEDGETFYYVLGGSECVNGFRDLVIYFQSAK